MSMKVTVEYNETVTPTLDSLMKTLEFSGQVAMRKKIAGRLETLVRNHLITAAKTRHKTANRLGATPSGYLTRRGVESFVTGNKDGLIRLTVYGEIFARVDGPVDVKPKKKKRLAIPAIKGAYGRRPAEIGGLRLVVFLDKKKAALAKVTGDGGKGPIFLRSPIFGPPKPSTDRWRRWKRSFGPEKPTPKVEVWYWLSKGVRLPQDRGLLPTDDQFTKAAEEGAIDFLEEQIQKQLGNGFTPPKA